jgi:hypothetical protein
MKEIRLKHCSLFCRQYSNWNRMSKEEENGGATNIVAVKVTDEVCPYVLQK